MDKYTQQKNRYDFLKSILESSPERDNGRKPANRIHRIIRGYLTEFYRQTENRTPVCNIEHGRSPEAKEYWSTRPQEEFWAAKVSAMYHTAVSFSNLRRHGKRNAGGLKAVWEAVGEIIRTSIDVFKQEYPALNPDQQAIASVYNDHQKMIEASLALEYNTGKMTIR